MNDTLQEQLMEQKMKVDFNSYDLSVKEIISMITDGLINIAPEYQRQFRWDAERQSSLIESLFLGIPVPAIFMATNPDGSWELIDGVQRISTILCFAGNDEERSKINAIKKIYCISGCLKNVLHIKQKVNHIAVLHDIFLAFGSHFACFFGFGFAA